MAKREVKEVIGTVGQYLSILICGFAIGYGAGRGAEVYWVMVTGAVVLWGIFTKVKGK